MIGDVDLPFALVAVFLVSAVSVVSPSVSAPSAFFGLPRPRAAGLSFATVFLVVVVFPLPLAAAAVLSFAAGAGLVTFALVLAFGFKALDSDALFLTYLICAISSPASRVMVWCVLW